MKILKLSGNPLEKDIQAWILASLGVEQMLQKTNKNGVMIWKGTGVFIDKHGSMFWRANSGGVPAASGRVIMGNPAGTADILGIVSGRMIGFEVKRPGGKQSSSQVRWQRWLENAGGIYAVVECPNDAKAILERMK